MSDNSQETLEQNVHLVGLDDYVRDMFGLHISTNLIRVNSALERLRGKRSQAAEDKHVALVAMFDALIACQVEHGQEFEMFADQLHLAAKELRKIDAKVKSTLPDSAHKPLG